MKLDLVFKNWTSQKSPQESFFVRLFDVALLGAKPRGKEIEVSVNLVGEAKIKELNKKYRKRNKTTDVLSFPLDNGSGDIFICLSIAKKEAKRENISVEAKLAQLTAHGFLHLLDYDHERSDKEAKKIFELENKILRKWQGRTQ